MKKPRLLVVGSFVMDLIVSTPRFPQSGETVLGTGYRTAPGGKGANQAVQAARLGAEVTMVGKVGQDAFGDALIESARAAGVDVRHVARSQALPSAVGNVQLETADGQSANRIIVVPGANMDITPEEVSFLQEEISRYDMLLLQQEIPMEITRWPFISVPRKEQRMSGYRVLFMCPFMSASAYSTVRSPFSTSPASSGMRNRAGRSSSSISSCR